MIDWSIKSAPAYHHFVECIPSSILIQSPTALFLYSYLFFFHFLFLLCEPRKWIKLPAVSHADRSLFFINKWASSLGRGTLSVFWHIFIYDRARKRRSGGNHASGFLMAFVWMALQHPIYATREGTHKKRERKKNCWITLPDQFMSTTREKPPSAMTWPTRAIPCANCKAPLPRPGKIWKEMYL